MIHYDAAPWKLQPAICGEPSAHGRTTSSSPSMVTCEKCLQALKAGFGIYGQYEERGATRNGRKQMRTDRIEDREQIRLALTVTCPICEADIDCLCDQFQAPHSLPFNVHVERYEAALKGLADAD